MNEAIIFIPMSYIAMAIEPTIIDYAAAITPGALVVLSAVTMFSGRFA
ncbi:MAG: hypothetical protein OEM85_17260 [Gammaproteobacteria bacterium]|nr:hypothetical protein [Gammaproteobacteria bacterium]MDH3375110.1 hypothetical protein [Gammaproteobacteria bacterium]